MNDKDAGTHSIGLDDLANLIGELRSMARSLLGSESGFHSFTPTALAMTALRRAKLKDQDWEDVRWENRAHFFASLAAAMRHALIDHARRRKAKGRESILYFAPDEIIFHNLAAEAEERPERIILLEEALRRLSQSDRRLADVVEQFYYLGHSIPDIARVGGVSEKTVDRHLKRARAALRKMVEAASDTSAT